MADYSNIKNIEEESEDYSCESSDQNQENFQSPRADRKGKNYTILRSNRKGLPVEVQRIILHCVLHCNGKDNFTRDYCDKNSELLGERHSFRRTSCQSKRRHFLKIRAENPGAFLRLCDKFGLTVPKNNSLLKFRDNLPTLPALATPATPAASTDSSTSIFTPLSSSKKTTR